MIFADFFIRIISAFEKRWTVNEPRAHCCVQWIKDKEWPSTARVKNNAPSVNGSWKGRNSLASTVNPSKHSLFFHPYTELCYQIIHIAISRILLPLTILPHLGQPKANFKQCKLYLSASASHHESFCTRLPPCPALDNYFNKFTSLNIFNAAISYILLTLSTHLRYN